MAEKKQTEVAEFQGFYGPFTVTERLLQKIWLRGDFNSSEAKTTAGESVEIRFPGTWNLLEGPDFKRARLRIGGRDVTGDVELHFRASDWEKHRHHEDPNYNDVVLHVLLFPPSAFERPARLANGFFPPVLSLLELLHHDLEEYAAEESLQATLDREHWRATEELVARPPSERYRLLLHHAKLRWEQKVHFARLRIKKLGWAEACHQTVLEILGYRRNRGAMLTLATRFPFSKWRENPPSEEELLQAVHWVIRGARPANHPKQRLRQYLNLVQARPAWPEQLPVVLASAVGQTGEIPGSRLFRQEGKLRQMRETIGGTLTADFVSGTRLDTLACDGYFPLVAAREEEAEFFPVWFSWYPGDFPVRVIQTLRTAAIADGKTFITCNGFCQGVLGLSLAQKDDPLVCFDPNSNDPSPV